METPRHGATTSSLGLAAFARYAERPAFAWGGQTLTYAASAQLVGRMQAVFVEAGLQRGARVAILAGNTAPAWCAAFAAQALAMTTTWLHPLGSFADQHNQIEDFQADLLIIDAVQFRDRGGELQAASGRQIPTLTLGKAEYGRCLLTLAQAQPETSPRDLARADDLITLNYTGGTTGHAKGAMRRQSAAAAVSHAVLSDFELPRSPRYLAVAPISHVAGTKIMTTLMRGGAVHMVPGFDPDVLCRVIELERINLTLLVPTMIYKLLDSPSLAKADLSSLELMLYGASPMSPTRLDEAMDRIGPVFAQLYGQTECYPIAYLPVADHDRRRPEVLSAAGFPISSNRVALLDENGEKVAPGSPGEICVRGPTVMNGYWKRPEETAEALAHGWLHTGDIARADEQGRLYIVDRKKDMIVTGGLNVYPREVEDVLTHQPGVSMAAVVGAPDPVWGETVVAYVVRRSGAELSTEGLIKAVRDGKGAASAPKRIEFVDELPLTSLGKVDKKAIRKALWADQQRQVG